MLTAEEAAEAVRDRAVSATELTQQALAAIAARDGALNAFAYVDADGALRAAAETDRCIAEGRYPGPLTGVPFGVKDLEDAAGMPTVRGSRWFAGSGRAARDDLHIARLRAAGAIPVGKTAVPEFGASGFVGIHDQPGPRDNP